MEIKLDKIMTEQWERWEPIKDINQDFLIEGIFDDINGFKIILCENDSENRLQILFENAVNFYQKTDEVFKLYTLGKLRENYSEQFYIHWNFFKIINSDYIKLLSKQSGGIADNYNLKHFVIIDDNSFLDIIVGYDPIVKWQT